VTVDDDEVEGGAMGGGGSDARPQKQLLTPKPQTLDPRAVEERVRKQRELADYRKFQIANALSNGQAAAALAKSDPAQLKRYEKYGNTAALAELLSMASGAPFIGSSLDELAGAVASKSLSGPDYERERDKAQATIAAAQAHAPAGPIIGSFALPLPKTPAGRIGFGTAQGALQGAGEAPTLDDVPRYALKDGVTGALSSSGAEVAAKGGAGTEGFMRRKAEEQALEAAGLRGGIANQAQQKLGVSGEVEARAVGRDFLNEGLIPFAGTKEDVARKAEALTGQAGNVIGATMAEADVASMHVPPAAAGQTVAGRRGAAIPGLKFDQFAGAARKTLDDASAVAEDLSGEKTRKLIAALERQNQKTPGSFVGANKAKSDAWKSARFDDDAPMSAVLYRNAVGAARDDLQQQVARVLGPDKANALAEANRKFGIGADALKLANDTGTRRIGNKLMGLGMDATLTSGGAALGQTLFGPIGAIPGGAAGLALSKTLGARGNAAAARTFDALSAPVGRAANAIGRGAQQLEPATTGALTADDARSLRQDKLAPYLELIGDKPDD
jgi:hypothetical protein